MHVQIEKKNDLDFLYFCIFHLFIEFCYRTFAYRTSAKTVYPLVEKGSGDTNVIDEQEELVEQSNCTITRILPR